MTFPLRAVLFATLLAAASPASAALIVTSYDMRNGNSGTYHYHDGTYNGSGNVALDNASLAGGTGVLTDGVIAHSRWDAYGGSYPNGPYVGWNVIDPTIIFHFASEVTINSVTLWFDDPGGYGGARMPASVIVGGISYVGTTGGAAGIPYALTISGLSLTGTDQSIKINRPGSGYFVFLSEVTFQGRVTSVSEPGSLLLFGVGLAGLGLLRRRVG